MSLISWIKEYYPVPVNKGLKADAIEQALLKWTGLRKERLEAHGLEQSDQDIRETCEMPECLSISNSTCSLCFHYAGCHSCPLARVRGGTPCMNVKDSEIRSPYALWRYDGNPESMIAWLIACNTKEDKMSRIIYGSPEFWSHVDDAINWVTVDDTGALCGYMNEPKWDNGWNSPISYYSDLFQFYTMPKWEDSKIRRPVVWVAPDENTPVDTPVWVRDEGSTVWHKRYWAGQGEGRCWDMGATSWSADEPDDTTKWSEVVIAQGDLSP